MNLLEVENLSVNYGRTEAIRSISFNLSEGQITSIIGSNGAGKSSLLKSISGLVDYQGSIRFAGQPLSRKANQAVAAGIVQVPEGRRIFSAFTVEQNLLAGAYLNKDRKEVKRMLDEQYALFPILADRCKQFGGTLSGGEQQMLAIGRALMSRPKLLLLDEPSLGLAPKIVNSVFRIIREMDAGRCVGYVEHVLGVLDLHCRFATHLLLDGHQRLVHRLAEGDVGGSAGHNHGNLDRLARSRSSRRRGFSCRRGLSRYRSLRSRGCFSRCRSSGCCGRRWGSRCGRRCGRAAAGCGDQHRDQKDRHPPIQFHLSSLPLDEILSHGAGVSLTPAR